MVKQENNVDNIINIKESIDIIDRIYNDLIKDVLLKSGKGNSKSRSLGICFGVTVYKFQDTRNCANPYKTISSIECIDNGRFAKAILRISRKFNDAPNMYDINDGFAWPFYSPLRTAFLLRYKRKLERNLNSYQILKI